MDDDHIVNAFNNWMKEFIKNPEGSEVRFQEQLAKYKADLAAGRFPTYGQESLQLLKDYAV